MKLLLKDFDKYNFMTCHYSGKNIKMGETFYSDMQRRASGAGWRKVWAVKASAAQRMVAAGEAKFVTWADLNAETDGE